MPAAEHERFSVWLKHTEEHQGDNKANEIPEHVALNERIERSKRRYRSYRDGRTHR